MPSIQNNQILRKKTLGGLTLPSFTTYYKTVVIQTVGCCHRLDIEFNITELRI